MVAIYVAASFGGRTELLRDVVAPLSALGHTVTSRWLTVPRGIKVLDTSGLKNARNWPMGREAAQECLQDIDRADMVVFFTQRPSSTGGYDVEFGYAYARWCARGGKGTPPIHVVGPLRNIFHTLVPSTQCHATIEAFLCMLSTV